MRPRIIPGKDDVFTLGLDSIDGEEFQEWLARHGARFPTTKQSALVRSLYGAPFAFEGGDPERPNMAAGAGLRALSRIFFGYKDAYLYKMQSGMGEIVFTPLYKALAKKELDPASGVEKPRVNLRFFHKVEHLGLSADGRHVATIRLTRQAAVKSAEYQPTIQVPLPGGDFECWPNAPQVDQLDPTTLPAPNDPGFESSWSQHRGESITLQDGADFDTVILAIPPAAHPHIAGELLAASPRWRQMVDQVKTIRTVAAQLWLLPKADALGWDEEKQFVEPPLIGGYVEPLNIIMDEAVILQTETWAGAGAPQSLFYLCGPMKDDPGEKPFSDPTYPETQTQIARDIARTWFGDASERLWPKVSVTGGLAWAQAFDPENRAGALRFDGQYARCNIDPAERYVLSLAGTTEARIGHRRKRDGAGFEDAGFENLFVAGDWTRNGINVGCVEGATVSGMQAVRAICGEPAEIPGEEDVAAR